MPRAEKGESGGRTERAFAFWGFKGVLRAALESVGMQDQKKIPTEVSTQARHARGNTTNIVVIA